MSAILAPIMTEAIALDQDTAAVASDEDTALALPETPPEVPETETEDLGSETDASEEAPETEEPFSLFGDQEVDLDELFGKDEKIKSWLEGKLKGERAKADESNRRKREAEVEQARRSAETEALKAQYQKDLTDAEQVWGKWGVDALSNLVKHVAQNGTDGVDVQGYVTAMAGKMLEANRSVAAQGMTQARAQIFGELYPGATIPEDVLKDWEKATYAKDLPAQNRAFAKAVAAAERAKVMAELEATAKSEADNEAKAAEKAGQLQEIEQKRKATPRPSVNLPIGKQKLVTQAEIDAIPTEVWLRKPQAERDEMLASLNRWREREAAKTR